MKYNLRIYLELLLFNQHTTLVAKDESNKQTGLRLDFIPVFYTYYALGAGKTRRKDDKKSYSIQWLFFRLRFERIKSK